MVKVSRLNFQSIQHRTYRRKVLTGRMPTSCKELPGSQARPASHIFFREGKCRVALMLLSCLMAWVSNLPWYLAITESIIVSLDCCYLFMMDIRPDIEPKSDRSFRLLLTVCIRWCFEESSVRKMGCRGSRWQQFGSVHPTSSHKFTLFTGCFKVSVAVWCMYVHVFYFSPAF